MKRRILEAIHRALNHPFAVFLLLLVQMAMATYAVYREWFAVAVVALPFIALDAWRLTGLVGRRGARSK